MNSSVTTCQRNERLFSEAYLAKFNGEDPGKPIYISVRVSGAVFAALNPSSNLNNSS